MMKQKKEEQEFRVLNSVYRDEFYGLIARLVALRWLRESQSTFKDKPTNTQTTKKKSK